VEKDKFNKMTFYGFGLGNPVFGRTNDEESFLPSFVVFGESQFNKNMSWGITSIYNYSSYTFYLYDNNAGFDRSVVVSTDYFGIGGHYAYHFLPPESKFQISGIASIGYMRSNTKAESDIYGFESGDLDIGIRGVTYGLSARGHFPLLDFLGIFAEVGVGGLSPRIQAGLTFN